MRPTVLLFDLDGTLVRTGGAGRRALAKAFDAETGRADACEGIELGGMTDRAIVRRGLANVGATRGDDQDEATIDRILEVYLGLLAPEVERTDGYVVLPGVVPVLDAVAGRASVAVGLGTGNIEPAAHVKLSRGGLSERFAFGGFGSDAEDRAALLRAGRGRGAARLGVSVEAVQTVIIGDTPRDVVAAQTIGAVCVGVGTGGHAPEALVELGADHAFPDLSAQGVVEALLGD